MSRPIITAARVRRLKLPLRQVYVSAMYVIDTTYRVIVELETESGLVGVGDTVGTEEVFAITARLAAGLVGADALNRQKPRADFGASVFENRNGRSGWAALAGVDLALWDLAGQIHGLSLAAMIGGIGRRDIDLVSPLPAAAVDRTLSRAELAAHYADRRNVARVVDLARAYRRNYGFRCFKYKSAGASAEWDVAVMGALREGLGPDIALRFDPNAAYGTAEAIALCARLEPFKLEFYEDPTDDIEGMAALRARMTTPLASNMVVIQPDHLPPAIRRGAVDTVLADLFLWGGIDNYRAMAAVVEAFGLDLAVHSLFETGIGTVANLHLASALPQIRKANDSGHHIIGADIVGAPALDIVDGRMALPAGSGLGLTIDAAALDRLTVAIKAAKA